MTAIISGKSAKNDGGIVMDTMFSVVEQNLGWLFLALVLGACVGWVSCARRARG